MFGNGKNLEFQFQTWQNLEFQCLKKPKFQILLRLEKANIRFPKFGKAKG